MIFKATLDESSEWVPYVYLLDVNDLVVGYDPDTGEIGLSNRPAQDLANRALYLKLLFEQEHSQEGRHAVTNAQVASGAGVQESKLSLDYPTATLHSAIEDALHQVEETRALIDEVKSDAFDLHDAVARAIPLSWVYSNKYFDFEMFIPTGELSLRNIVTPIEIVATTAGDDSIDVSSTADLHEGRTYVVSDSDGVASYRVTILSILSSTRFRCTTLFPVNLTSGTLSSTSWGIPEDGNYALAKHNSYLVTRPIVGLEGYNSGKVVIRCNNVPCELLVQSKASSGGDWSPCVLEGTASREIGYTDYEFSCPGGDIELSILVTTTSPSTEVLVRNICVMPVSEYLLSDDVRQPSCVTPAQGSSGIGETPALQGSAYYSLYGVPQGAAQFQVSTDAGFGSLAVDKTVNLATTSTTVIAGALEENMTYFWRCRYKDTLGAWSKWSGATQFATSAEFVSVATPVNASPGSGQRSIGTLGCQLTSSAFRVIGGGEDAHEASVWQLATDPSFSTLTYDSGEQTAQKTFYTVPFGILETATYYFWRVKHKGTLLGWSHWSTPTRFQTATLETTIAVPTAVEPAFGADKLSITSLRLRSSNFNIVNGTDTHEMSQWQVYDTADFEADPSAHLVYGTGYTAASLTMCTIPEGLINYETKYFWRVRHRGALIGWSDWSAVSEFTTVSAVSVATPTNVSPENGSAEVPTLNPVLTASAFVALNAPTDVHTYSEWQVSSSESFSSDYLVYQSGITSVDLTSHRILSNVFNLDATYYWRVRYTGSKAGTSSWSEPTSFKTALAASIATPTAISPEYGAASVSYERITFVSTDFAVENVNSVHEASQWQISTDASFTVVTWDSGALPASVYQAFDFTSLNFSTNYYWRVRYKGTYVGWSSWSAGALFTTNVQKRIVTPHIVTPANSAQNFPKFGAYVTGSPFQYEGSVAQHAESRWVLATYTAGTNTYTTIHTEVTSGNSLLTCLLPDNKLTYGAQYFLKVQYKATDNNWSDYSAWSAFSVVQANKFFQYFVSESDTSIESVTSDAAGNVYYAVKTLGASSRYTTTLYKYSKANTLTWKKAFNDVVINRLLYSGTTGSLICAGTAMRGYGDTLRPALLKVAADASVVWSKYVNYTGADTPSGQFLAAYELPGGDIVCSGNAGTRALVVTFSSAGSVKWHCTVTNFNAFTDVSLGRDSLAFVGTKSSGETSPTGSVYYTPVTGPTQSDMGSLYSFSLDNAGVYFNAAWCDPNTNDLYVAGRMKHKSLFGKLSNASKEFSFLKQVNDGPDSAVTASPTPKVTNPGITITKEYHDPGGKQWHELGRRDLVIANNVDKISLSGYYTAEHRVVSQMNSRIDDQSYHSVTSSVVSPDDFYTAVDVYVNGTIKMTWASPEYKQNTYNWAITVDKLVEESSAATKTVTLVFRYIQQNKDNDNIRLTAVCNYLATYDVGSTFTPEYSGIYSLAKDPYSNAVYACGYKNFDRCAALVYKFSLDGTGLWGRYIEGANTNFGFFDKFNATTYSEAQQAVLSVGTLSNNSKNVYSIGSSVTGFRYGITASITPDAQGTSFTSGAAAPNTLRMYSDQNVFPNNANFTNVSVARSTRFAAEHVALNYYTSVAALDIVYTNTDFPVTVNGPYSY